MGFIKRNSTWESILALDWVPGMFVGNESGYEDGCVFDNYRGYHRLPSGEMVIFGGFKDRKEWNKARDKLIEKISKDQEKAEKEQKKEEPSKPVRLKARPRRPVKFVIFLTEDEHAELLSLSIEDDISMNAYARRKIFKKG